MALYLKIPFKIDKDYSYINFEDDDDDDDDGDVIKRVAGYEIRAEDLTSLEGTNWLTDQIINATFQNLCTSKIFFKDTFFLETLKRKGMEGVQKIKDISTLDYVFFPYHIPGHWSLVVFDVRRTTVSLLDPMKNIDSDILHTIGKYLRAHGLKVSRNKGLEKEAPAQNSSGDCGVFVIAYAHVLVDGGSLKELKVCYTKTKEMGYFSLIHNQ
ncbi:sentrin-specific protease 3-like [Mytilus trossulus]|uniref:sentrin-specific protease 3-like n=1 Tax=Mytilus trossulus TaxID=6551 RepID=UPI0030059D90